MQATASWSLCLLYLLTASGHMEPTVAYNPSTWEANMGGQRVWGQKPEKKTTTQKAGHMEWQPRTTQVCVCTL
jgi:hypothetical protein